MQNLSALKSSHQCYRGLRSHSEPCQRTPKTFLNMIKLNSWFFGLKDEATKAFGKRNGKKQTINCHHSDVLWNPKTPFLVKFSHRKFPLFSTDIQTFDKNVNLSKQTRKQRKSLLLVFPSLNTSNFTTYLKIASTLTPFWGARLKSHPSKFRSLTF